MVIQSKIKNLLILLGISILAFSCGEDTFSLPQADRTPPQAIIISPVDGEPVFGDIVIQARATDNEKVDSVQFFVNQELIGTTEIQTNDIFDFIWNSSDYDEDEYHYISIVAWDIAENNYAPFPIRVLVDNSDNETQSESILIEVANPYPLPTEFPLVDNTAWVYKIQRYNSATEYLLDMNPEIFLDTLYIFSSPEDYFLYSWQPTESFSMVKNYDNKLLSIGFIDLISDTLYFYEKQDPIL